MRAYDPRMTPRESWLAAMWPRIHMHLPPAPARVLEVGCGPAGGFVPALISHGYDALGIDPEAPDEAHYLRVEFERATLPWPPDALVASASLHHVADPAEAVDRIVRALPTGGVVVVVEWAWEALDEQTAEWCFARLGTDGEPGWLHRRRDEWLDSGREWSAYFHAWAAGHGIHPGGDVVELLDARLERRHLTRGPYFFPNLAGTSEADEQRAIDDGRIRATRIDYVGSRR